jgi:hypothetical protein
VRRHDCTAVGAIDADTPFFCCIVASMMAAGIYGWSRDLVRETIKKCNMVSVNVFIFGFTPFVLSEAILFISIFWGLIHFVSSPFFSFQESLFHIIIILLFPFSDLRI